MEKERSKKTAYLCSMEEKRKNTSSIKKGRPAKFHEPSKPIPFLLPESGIEILKARIYKVIDNYDRTETEADLLTLQIYEALKKQQDPTKLKADLYKIIDTFLEGKK